jgi:hypothetical protein
MRIWLFFALLVSGCNAVMGGLIAAAEGPPSSEGHLVGGGHEPGFVQRPEAIFALHKGRLLRLQTDGSRRDELLDHVDRAEVSPAGDAIATFGERGLVIVDTGNGSLRRLAPRDDSCRVVSLLWDQSGRSLAVEYSSSDGRPASPGTRCEPASFVDAITGQPASPEPRAAPRRASAACVPPLQLEPGECGGLNIVEAGGQSRPLIRIEGCYVSRHYGAPLGIGNEFFADDCRALVFNFDGSIFIADMATGRVSHLAFGRLLH